MRILLVTPLVALACSSSATPPPRESTPPAPDAVKAPSRPVADDGPLLTLQTGTVSAADGGALAVSVVSSQMTRDAAYYRLEVGDLPEREGEPSRLFDYHLRQPVGDHLAEVVDDGTHLLVRTSAPGQRELSGVIYAWGYGTRGTRFTWSVRVPERPATDASLALDWARGFPAGPTPWHRWASVKLRQLAGETRENLDPESGDFDLELERSLGLVTGTYSIQQSMQANRAIRGSGPFRAHVAISTLRGPELAPHPWPEMRRALRSTPRTEPLASKVPATFWYARFASLPLFLELVDQGQDLATAGTDFMFPELASRGVRERYQTQLALSGGRFAKLLGDTVVSEMAVVGSDPYLTSGSDLTVLFRVKARPIFDAELERQLGAAGQEVPGIATRSESHRGVAITVARDPLGRVRRHRANLGDVVAISNSPGALRRIIDVHLGRAPSLETEPDLQYMLARDNRPCDGFIYLGDRFIAEVVGPAQKIAEGRRQRALAELTVPGNASLLFGWLHGREPKNDRELRDSRLITDSDLVHFDGSRMSFSVEDGALSRWGRVAALTPLIDLPAITKITTAEQRAYDSFSREYARTWGKVIDPIAVRITRTRSSTDDRIGVDVRILPLLEAREYRELAEVVGDARISPASPGEGLRIRFGLGKDARLRRELESAVGAFGRKLEVSWVGEWIEVGVDDRAPLLEMFQIEDIGIEPPSDRRQSTAEIGVLDRFPFYAAIDVGNRAVLAATLLALRGVVEETIPGAVRWQNATYGDLDMVRVVVRDDDLPETGIDVFYAVTSSTLIVASDAVTLARVADRLRAQADRTAAPEGPQLTIGLATPPGKAMATAIGWLLSADQRRRHRLRIAAAEVVLQGSPSIRSSAEFSARALTLLGSVPLDSRGGFEFVRTAGGIADPVLGTVSEPIFPPLPIRGSGPWRLLSRLREARSGMSFDREPGTGDHRSLHVTLDLSLESGEATPPAGP